MEEKTSGVNYEIECKRLGEELRYIKDEYERKIQSITQQYDYIVREKDDEIKWLKSVINGILHI